LIRTFKYYLSFFILLQIYLPDCLASKDSLFVISNIAISGNKVTQEKIIIRELTFHVGDTVSSDDLPSHLERSRDNVLNTSLFNFVTIDYIIISGNNISINIILVERWYIWPVPIFEHAERNLGAFFKNRDWSKINYGILLNWKNFRGRKEILSIKARFGYKEQFLLTYNKPNIGKNQKFGVLAGINKFRMHEVHINTFENKPVYLKFDSIYLYQDFSSSINFSYRNHLYLKHSLIFSYMEILFRDSLTHMDYLGIPYQQKSRFFSLEYIIEYDFRDSKTYPLKGQYLRINLRQRGLGIIPDYNQTRTSFLLYGAYHKQWSNHWYHNQAALINVAPDKRDPGTYRTGIGYVAYLRGYELNTVEGTSSAIFSNNLKYCFAHEKTYTIPGIPWSQFNKTHLSFYGNLFIDAGYARGNFPDFNNNSYINKFLYSVGLGLDLVTYYDQVIRFETSVNRQGHFGFYVSSEIPFKRW
jgi:outer membrane protein assembly factor BamA